MRWLMVLLALLLLTACAPRPVDYEQVSPQDRIVVRFSHVTAENSPKHLGALRFAAAARARTAGRVEVQVFPNSQLYKDGEEISALQDGTIHLIAPTASKLAQLDPAWEVFDLPYLFQSFADVERLYDSPVGLAMRQRLEAKGLVPLAIWPNGFKQVTNLRHPLVHPQDFKGLRFRVQAGRVLQDQFQVLGASTIVSSFDSVYAAVQQHAIDGQENTLNNIYTRNLQEVQPYLTISDHGYLAYVVLAQAEWWNSLQPGLRAALQSALADATQWTLANAQSMNDDALAKITASGRVQVYTLSPAERQQLRAAFAPVYQAAADRLGTPFMDQVLAVVKGGQ